MKEKIVSPGEELGTAEEFQEGENTFQENGFVFSDSVGKAEFDSQNYEVKVQSRKEVKLFHPGSRVYGIITATRKNRAYVKILKAFDNSEQRVFTKSKATLMIAAISKDYVKDIRNRFRIGDIILAEVETVKPYGINLRTNKPELGVVKAFCSKCRNPMQFSGKKLMCTNCGNVEKRELSKNYSLK